MLIKGLVDEDFVNYKKPSMFIAFPSCTFKCEKDCGLQVCQNSTLATAKTFEMDCKTVVQRYINNPISKSIVIGGLEPFDSFDQLNEFVHELRHVTKDDIVIFTGYYKNEIVQEIDVLSQYENIVIKFGRFIPSHSKHYDDVLGVELASDNQYAERIS